MKSRDGNILFTILEKSYFRFFEHFHFKKIRPESLYFRATLYGGISLVISFIILCITGMLLMYYYVPSEAEAWNSMLKIEREIPWGSALRSIHNFSAQLMVFSLFVHLVSIVLRKAYTREKGANWLIGMVLFGITIFLSYTGYLLPFDQLGYWAITVGVMMAESAPLLGDGIKNILLGGSSISDVTILRFYVHHCITLPVVALVLLGLHMYLVRRDKGLELQHVVKLGDIKIQSKPTLYKFEWLFFICTFLLLMLVAVLWKVDLEPPANPLITPNPAKAPWYFVGLQELLHFYPPFLVSYIIPLVLFVFICFIPFFPDTIKTMTGEHYSRATWNLSLLGILFLAFVCSFGFFFNMVLFALSFLFCLILIRLKNIRFVHRVPILHIVLLYLLMLFSSYTFVGFALRGENWELIW